jgi:hypothetical protein
MQSDDRAEYEADKVCGVFAQVLNDEEAATKLLEHVRYRTGLLLERRPGVFAFAHLTFQEYLAARAVHEGNRLALDASRLVREHADPRWKEVIALYCGLAPASAAIEVIEGLVNQLNTPLLSSVLSEAYLSCGPEVAEDSELRRQVIERIACAPRSGNSLMRFPADEVAPIANRFVGCTQLDSSVSESYGWLSRNREALQERVLIHRLKLWRETNPFDVGDLNHLLHRLGSNDALKQISADVEMYASPGPSFSMNSTYATQAEVAVLGLRERRIGEPGVDATLLEVLRVLSRSSTAQARALEVLAFMLDENGDQFPNDNSSWPEFASLLREVSRRLADQQTRVYTKSGFKLAVDVIESWVNALDRKIAKSSRRKTGAKGKPIKTAKGNRKKAPRRRKP